MEKNNRYILALTWFCYWLILAFFYHRPGDLNFTLAKASFITANHLFIFWVSSKYLLPKFYDKKKWFPLLLFVFAILALLFILNFYFSVDFDHKFKSSIFEKVLDRKPHGRKRFHPAHILFLREISMNVIVFFGSTIYHLNKKLRLKQQREIELENKRLDAEMNFLKSQINPHFLFNAMNNVYSLAIQESKQVPDKILKLSEMLRYVLYHTDNSHVQLHQEISYVRNFIDFQLLKDDRYSKAVSLELSIENDRVSIAPMILIPFIENAFKHGLIDEENPLTIKLISDDEKLEFHVSNSLDTEHYVKDKTGGIGVKNVKRRLELIYGDKHKLKVDKADNRYNIHLVIYL